MKVSIDASDFMKSIDGLTEYAQGFVEELSQGETVIAKTLGKAAETAGYKFIDALARTHHDRLHHVYEWYHTGDPSARLFELSSKTVGKGLVNISTKFLPSTATMQNSPNWVFKEKARVMESGQSVEIYPVFADALVFENPRGSGQWFTSQHVHVPSPGGEGTDHAFEDAFNAFSDYFKSSFLKGESTIMVKLKNLGQYFKGDLRRPSRSAGKNAAKRFLASIGDADVFDE